MSKGPVLIVAMDAANGIGKDNAIPWKLPEDMRHFRATTSGHIVIMGRRTFESIGKPLPNRLNIVVTSQGAQPWNTGAIVTNSLRNALSLAANAPELRTFVIGGGQLYREALPIAEELIVTHLPQTYECDTFFPKISEIEWEQYVPKADSAPSSESALDIRYYRRPLGVAWHPV
jgi:dihydrofolate reductase